MADTAAALVIQLDARFQQFERDMKRATGVFDAEGRKIERRQAQLKKNLEKGFGNVGRNVAGLLSAGAIVAFGRNILNTADALSDASQQLGVTTQQLQGLDYAARVSGASSEKLTQALGFLTDGLGEAQKGEGDLAKFMRDNNIQMGDTVDVLYDLANRVQRATTQQEKLNIATTAFGAKAGKTMVSFLNQGAEGLRRLQEEAAAKGQIWDQDTLQRLDAAKDSFETLEKAIVNIAAIPASEFLDDLSGFLNLLSEGNWQAALNKLAHLLPVIAGAGAGAVLAGPLGAVAGGVLGAGAAHVLAPHEAGAVGQSGAQNGRARTRVPLSKADTEKAARDAEKALRDAARIREVIASATEDARRASDDAAESLRDTVRAQDQALLSRIQGSVHFAEVQKEVIDETAKLDIQSLQDRRDAEIRALDLRQAQDLEHLRELKASKDEEQKVLQAYADQRVSIEGAAAAQITAIQVKQAEEILSIRTREVEVSDELRSGLEDVAAAGLHGFDSLKDAAASFLEQMAEMIIRLYVIKPLLESVLGPSGSSLGGGGGGGILSAITSLFGFAKGGVMTPQGPRALQRFAGGGVSRKAAIFGEAGPEAAVPLPDGRKIPVDLRVPNVPAGSARGMAPVYAFDLRGAVMTSDLLKQMNSIGDRAAQRGAVNGAQMAVKVQPQRAQQARMLEN